MIEISVEDDGPGIPEADFERMLAPFVRLEFSRNRTTAGTGLGVAIASAVARGHGGDVTHAIDRTAVCARPFACRAPDPRPKQPERCDAPSSVRTRCASNPMVR